MRFSAAALLALPLLATAAESPLDQYKAKFQNFLGSFGAKAPQAPFQEAAAPAAADSKSKAKGKGVKSKNIETLTLENWDQTLFAPVKAESTTPEEWWVLVSGGNKTCFGHCLKIEAAYKDAATKFANVPKAPHLAYLNCDDQPVLCNSWSAGTASLWIFEMVPRPAPIDLYLKRLNITTTTAQTFLDYHASGHKEGFKQHTGYFHPFDGFFAQNGLSVPVGYFFWLFNAIPSWAMMLGVSFLSRTFMNRRMNPNRNQGAAPAAAAPRGAPPGDARS